MVAFLVPIEVDPRRTEAFPDEAFPFGAVRGLVDRWDESDVE